MSSHDTPWDIFRSQAMAEGYEEVVERDWAPHAVVDTHTHPFAVKALMVRGEMWLTADGQTRHLQPGDRFELAYGAPHAERYGDQGATYWVARKSRV